MAQLTKSQVRALGERLARGPANRVDINLLEAFRASFEPAYEFVVGQLTNMGYVPTGRSAKTTASIAAKVRRERTNLWRMQDIAGCRIVVEDPISQALALLRVADALKTARVDDRRNRPSNGYRAVHVIVEHEGRHVEVQIRTNLQQAWAEACEKAADVFDSRIKYGEGPDDVLAALGDLSTLIGRVEVLEFSLRQTEIRLAKGTDVASVAANRMRIEEMREEHLELLEQMKEVIRTHRKQWG